ncbi:MAG: hypothetical protein Q8N35_13595 [Methylococcaceae bacterium]|jgi:hypothetical protein|uniref:hypothetical protein n=1 Tax=Methylicorpusculum sp. TaxID=2713644 RepID=UPI00271B0E64|nr:hypothetical protein [Methylicorpusculum sp.]MDO9161569.1 hypothetical protein [Methylococcaceae bacterium]MDZ4155551.1 hypothetical protein [Methylococcales bacterium]MDP2395274.1 hypothetical protein [Methylococcaceae bacterium]MDP3020614.1 hypothetical protein [Methylococcaceae bacterium]MDP3390053.1 hypothetical protein [Methylococcaceae bacterium]
MFHSLITFLLLLTLCSCTWNNQSPEQQDSSLLPNREETVSFFSSVHKTVRDTELGIYGLLYGVRDGVDSFVYDVQKDYYQDYQK